MNIRNWQQKISSFLALFTSAGTLICCALPAAISVIAGGAALTSLISTFPWLVTLSMYKDWIFGVAVLLLLISSILIYRPKGTIACTVTGGEGCETAGRFTKITFWASIVILLVGAFFAYVLFPVQQFLGI